MARSSDHSDHPRYRSSGLAMTSNGCKAKSIPWVPCVRITFLSRRYSYPMSPFIIRLTCHICFWGWCLETPFGIWERMSLQSIAKKYTLPLRVSTYFLSMDCPHDNRSSFPDWRSTKLDSSSTTRTERIASTESLVSVDLSRRPQTISEVGRGQCSREQTQLTPITTF